jgi:Mycothiol maleylpyruvate isomerase N-terminal domain
VGHLESSEFGKGKPKGERLPDLAQAFREIRLALSAQLREADDVAWSTPIPIRPQWTVKDTVAMLAGFARAIVEGAWLEDYSDAWADPDIRRRLLNAFNGLILVRRNRSGRELLDEWETCAVRLERMMDRDEPFPEGIHPFAGWTYLWAVVQNAHNIWSALHVASTVRESAATGMVLESAVYWLDMRLQATGTPALRIRSGDREWVVGDGIPQASVTAPAFELFRALSGRRSIEQILAFDWDGDPGPYLGVFSPFEAPADAFVE